VTKAGFDSNQAGFKAQLIAFSLAWGSKLVQSVRAQKYRGWGSVVSLLVVSSEVVSFFSAFERQLQQV
jgi:hypothetical protein